MSKLDEQLITLVLEKLDKTHGIVTNLDKKLDLHVQRTEQEFEAIKVLDEQQNALLDEHAKRSDRLEKDNVLREAQLKLEFGTTVNGLDNRVSALEAPLKWFLTTKKGLMWVAGIATSLVALIELLKFITGN
jgi:hypothetical protein